MADERQQILNTVITALRGLGALNLPDLLQQTARQLAVQYQLTPTEQAAITQSLGVATIFEHTNVAQGNETGGNFSQKTQSGGNSFDGAHISHMRDAVAGDTIAEQHNYYGDPPRALGMLLRQYLLNLAASASRIPLPDGDSADTSQREVLLSDIYTRLEVVRRTSTSVLDIRDDTPLRQLSAFEALVRHRHVVLLGAPGSGKSTVVNGLVWALAHHGLSTSDADLLTREGWTATQLTPIMINLSLWNRWLRDHPTPTNQPLAAFWQYLAAADGLALDQTLVDHLIQATGLETTLIVCDGLDEVPIDHHAGLTRLKTAIMALAQTGVSHLIVTCRVLDYERPERQFNGWPTETLLPFSDDLQQAFIGRWYATLDRLGRRLLDTPAVLRPKLQAAVRSRTDLRRIAGNPLLLTMMALLHASQGELPDKRVKLYSECVDLLVRRWRRFKVGGRDQPSLEEYLHAGDRYRGDVHDWTKDDTEHVLNRLAFVAHSQIHADDSGAGTNISEAVLMHELTVTFRGYGFKKAPERAVDFCNYISANDNGILQRHDADVFRFPHRTFQEFLAARYLVGERGWAEQERDLVTRLLSRCDRPEWREVLQLAVSKLVNDGTNVRAVVTLIEKLLSRNKTGSSAWARSVTIAAELLVEVPRTVLSNLGVREAKVWERVINALWLLLDPKQVETHSLAQSLLKRLQGDSRQSELLNATGRVRAGTALGYLMAPELRTKVEPDWCLVPAGHYPIGSDNRDAQAQDDEKPQRMIELAAFKMSRYPVTNAQYRQFVHDHGYENTTWWSDQGWQQRISEGWTEPRFWDDARFNGDLQPVVGVSWYEADAFCRWLSEYLGYTIQLPTDAQWEAAARGPQGLIYPWGDKWQDGRANVNGQFAGTTPVVCFASGASWCGVLDMSGNVWEWTASDFTNPDRTYRVDGLNNSTCVSFRGGSWNFNPQFARSAYRVRDSPLGRGSGLGIRCVCALE